MLHAVLVEGADSAQRNEVARALRDESGLTAEQEQAAAQALAGSMFR